jgi:hypothetical protein
MWIAFITCEGFENTHRAMIVGFLQSNGAPDVQSRQVTHVVGKPFAIVKCNDEAQYGRVIAACAAREFNRVECGGLHPFPIRVRRFTP